MTRIIDNLQDVITTNTYDEIVQARITLLRAISYLQNRKPYAVYVTGFDAMNVLQGLVKELDIELRNVNAPDYYRQPETAELGVFTNSVCESLTAAIQIFAKYTGYLPSPEEYREMAYYALSTSCIRRN